MLGLTRVRLGKLNRGGGWSYQRPPRHVRRPPTGALLTCTYGDRRLSSRSVEFGRRTLAAGCACCRTPLVRIHSGCVVVLEMVSRVWSGTVGNPAPAPVVELASALGSGCLSVLASADSIDVGLGELDGG